MDNFNGKMKDLFTPGSSCAKAAYGILFFLIGLLFIFVGFWKALLVLLFTLVGVFIGSGRSVKKTAADLINKVIPEKNQKVVYTQDDLEKVRKATEKNRGNAEKTETTKDETTEDAE
ncbi:MAG: DUF2273 domain-containing protein [Bacillota bacterium]|nr:DUF2273 domain-containing protein [Bacillota bacterium]